MNFNIRCRISTVAFRLRIGMLRLIDDDEDLHSK